MEDELSMERVLNRARLYRLGWRTSAGGLIIFFICVTLFAMGFDSVARKIELYAICMFVFGLQWVWEYRKYSSQPVRSETGTHLHLLNNARQNLECAWRTEQASMTGRSKTASYVFGQIARATLPIGYVIFMPYIMIDWLTARLTLPRA